MNLKVLILVKTLWPSREVRYYIKKQFCKWFSGPQRWWQISSLGTSPGIPKQGIVTWLGRPEDAGFEISWRIFFINYPKSWFWWMQSQRYVFLVRWLSTLERLPWWLGRTEALWDFEMWKVILQLFGPFRVYLEVWCCFTCFCVKFWCCF